MKGYSISVQEVSISDWNISNKHFIRVPTLENYWKPFYIYWPLEQVSYIDVSKISEAPFWAWNLSSFLQRQYEARHKKKTNNSYKLVNFHQQLVFCFPVISPRHSEGITGLNNDRTAAGARSFLIIAVFCELERFLTAFCLEFCGK